jgi:NTP pyrophosphatase (non-canonical NTP hydrolase)
VNTFDEFEQGCDDTWYGNPTPDTPLLYLAVTVAEEAGEICGKVKKLHRDDRSATEVIAREKAIKLEMGDLLFYMSRMAKSLGTTLSEIAQMNHDKLADRYARGVIRGDGDER